MINENLTDYKDKIACYWRKSKKASLIEKCYSRDGAVHIATKDGYRNKATNVFYMNQLLDLFSGFNRKFH